MCLKIAFRKFGTPLQTRDRSPDSFIYMRKLRHFLAVVRSLFHSSLLYIPILPPFSNILPHHILPSLSWFTSQSFFPNFIYNTLFGILLSSILCSCPKQHNLFKLIVSITVGFQHTQKFIYWLISTYFLFRCHILDLKSDIQLACEISVIPTATISDIPSLSVRSQQLYTPSID